MKKVAFSISNVRSKSDKKISGFGYLSEGNLLRVCKILEIALNNALGLDYLYTDA